jgi:hypothetical protein
VVAFYRLLITTPALSAAIIGYATRADDVLAAALLEAVPTDDDLTARLAAGQIGVVQRTLAGANQERIIAGQSADAIAADAVAAAHRAFDMLGGGLAPYR